MTNTATYLWPGTVHVGFGVAAQAAQEVKERGGQHVFVVVDPGVQQAGLLAEIQANLEKAGLAVTVFDGVVPNADADSVHAAVTAYRDAAADTVLGLGGGSALDTAKAVKLLAAAPAAALVAEFATALGDKGRPHPQPGDMPPFLALPTTAGTGAEVTPWAVISDAATKRKFGIGGIRTIPDVALVDPALTLTLPPALTAATGMDALTHLVEAYVSTRHNPILDPMILAGIEKVGRYLRIAVAQGANRTARAAMAEAALMGGIAISSKWLGACHSLAHPLSGLAGVHHGLACGITLPHQMAFSLSGALERYAAVAAALDTGRSASAVRDQAQGAVQAVHDLLSDIGLPARLRDAGVAAELIPELAAAAIQDLNWWTNPRAIDEQDMAAIYRAAW